MSREHAGQIFRDYKGNNQYWEPCFHNSVFLYFWQLCQFVIHGGMRCADTVIIGKGVFFRHFSPVTNLMNFLLWEREFGTIAAGTHTHQEWTRFIG